jgi:hypothetical protein
LDSRSSFAWQREQVRSCWWRLFFDFMIFLGTSPVVSEFPGGDSKG